MAYGKSRYNSYRKRNFSISDNQHWNVISNATIKAIRQRRM
nr:truncated AcrIIA5 [Streptococcus phage D1126]